MRPSSLSAGVSSATSPLTGGTRFTAENPLPPPAYLPLRHRSARCATLFEELSIQRLSYFFRGARSEPEESDLVESPRRGDCSERIRSSWGPR